ncbi:UNVERIFIED_CONTAM: hypothetical protein K2H54_010713 [Gekko kuhli]
MGICNALGELEDAISEGKGITTLISTESTPRKELHRKLDHSGNWASLGIGIGSNGIDIVGTSSASQQAVRVFPDEQARPRGSLMHIWRRSRESLGLFVGLTLQVPEAKDAVDLAESPLGVGRGGKALELEDWDITRRRQEDEDKAEEQRRRRGREGACEAAQ